MNQPSPRISIYKRALLLLVMGLMIWTSIPTTVYAQIPSAVTVVADPQAVILDQNNKVQDRVGKAILATGLSGLMNAASYFMRKLAYDTAKYVSSGGKGQEALVFEDGFGPYLKNTSDAAFGEIIAEFSDLTGLNLCQIPDPQFNLFLTFGIRGIYADGPPTAGGCSWTSFRDSWSADAWQERFNRYGDQLNQSLDQYVTGEFLRTNTVEQSEFGIAFGAIAQVDRLVTEKEEAARLDRLEGQGFRSVTDLISGNVRTPAAIVQEETTAATAKGNTNLTSGQIAGIYGAGSLQILPQAASVFLNTLTSDLLQKLLTDGLLPQQNRSGNIATDEFAGPAAGRRQAAEQAFNFLFTSVPSRQLNAYDDDLINQFATCPEYPGVYNCVIDSNFQQILDRARIGEPMTIQEAMESQPALLNPNWPLIPPDRPQDNQNKDCYLNKFCYSNVQKLRKARILPLGFEIATTLGDPDNPTAVTLGDVVNGYNDCAVDSEGNERRTPEFPYCHLIDPNWIIKMPEAICEALVYSPVLEAPTSPNRQQECADLATCVAYNDDGQCISYGYCLQEENTWNMPGQSCPAEYATCRSYVQQSNGAAVSYLNRTVDFGMCGPDNVGCLAYSIMKDADDEWVGSIQYDTVTTAAGSTVTKKATGLNQVVHINSRINNPQFTCNEGDAGCTQFRVANIQLDGNTVVSASPADVEDIALQKAPDYLTCYDSDRDISNGVQWPTTVAEAITAKASNAACEQYAPGCVAEEVGCKLWDPVNGGTSVPGKIGNNSCSAECVGYDTFRQRETVFEPAIDPMYFIPSYGATCQSQYEGCSEFTNMESLAQGGEQLAYFTELRHCELPNGQNQKTFYSWEGSDVEGFVLRVHQLAQYTESDRDLTYYQDQFSGEVAVRDELFVAGAPKYAARTIVALRELYTACNEDAYNLRIEDPFADGAASIACREFYDDAGTVYYREIDQIVSVSNACIDFRKTDTILSVDENLAAEGEGICEERGGLWQDDTCNVCRGGGVYEDGTCIYSTIPAESTSCPAFANECRAYVGNTGENIRRVDLGTFESETEESWTGATVSVSTESPFANQHSLRIVGSATKNITPNQLQTGTTDAAYEVRFWARGVPQQIGVSFTDPSTASFGQVAIGDVWREYTLGPISATDIDTSVTNTIQISGSGAPSAQFFVDNIEIVRTSAYTYLLKNSWQQTQVIDGIAVALDVPLVCDSTPGDIFPGEALGCSLYQNANNPAEQRAVTSFESLCREDAIGCTAVYDTQNTVGSSNEAELEHWYNARCVAGTNPTITADSTTRPLITEVAGTCTVYAYGATVDATSAQTTLGTCTIRPGDDYCYIERIVVPDHQFIYNDTDDQYDTYYDALVSESTFITQADTPVDAPIFISNQREFQCRDVGCTELGQELQTLADPTNPASYDYNTVYARLTPENFTNTSGGREPLLCTGDGVGCDAFSSSGNLQYFKDPKVTGNSICEYRDNVRVGTETLSGWFQTGVGLCTGTTDICSADDDCSAGVSCNRNTPVACYDGYITLENEYGIWSNNTPDNYEGFVGACEPQFNGCTEFIDRAATSRTSPEGDKYYTIFNDQLTARVDECDGQVGLKDGCVLFDQTDKPNKLYNTAATYEASESKPGDQFGLVDPITTGAATDVNANIILNVDRDRQCAEWLECRLSRPEVDENGQTTDVCIMYDVCLEADASGGCAVWNDDIGTGYCSADSTISCTDTADCGGRGSCIFQNTLTIDTYTNRDTSWYGRDYSGYSVLNMRPYTTLEPVVFDIDPLNQYLAYVIPERVFEEVGLPAQGCSLDDDPLTELEVCGLANEGVCYIGKCIAPISGRMSDDIDIVRDITNDDGSSDTGDGAFGMSDRTNEPNAAQYRKVMNSLVGSTCKAPPEVDAPYAATILATIGSDVKGAGIQSRYPYELPELGNRKTGFVRANIYQDPFNIIALSNVISEGAPSDSVYRPYVSSCIYTKVGYNASVTDYIPINQQRNKGICTAGSDIGETCESSADCNGAGAICSLTSAVQTHIGLDGFCLQKDLSRPINGGSDFACLVWLPMQISASRIDVYNNVIEAGYYPVPQYDAPTVTQTNSDGSITELNGGYLYCAESTNFGQGLGTSEYKITKASGAILEQAYDLLGTALRIERTNIPYKPSSDGGDEYTLQEVYDSTRDLNEYGFFSWCLEPARGILDTNIARLLGLGSDTNSVNTSICDTIFPVDPEYVYTQEEAETFYCLEGITVSVAGYGEFEVNTCPNNSTEMINPINSIRVDEIGFDPITTGLIVYNPIGSGDLSGATCNRSYFTADGPRLSCSTKNEISNRDTKIGRALSRCGRTGIDDKVRIGRYQQLVCDTPHNSGTYQNYTEGLYSLLQTWAWDEANIGLGAHILRVEYAGTNTSERTDNYGAPGSSNQFALFPNDTFSSPRRYGYGTLPLLGPQSEGYQLIGGNTSHRRIYSTGIETELYESMIDQIYVVPLRYPDGHNGEGPALMTNQFKIDFNNTIYTGSADSVNGYKPGDGDGSRQNNLEFPVRKTSGGSVSTYKELLSNGHARYVAIYYDESLTLTVPSVEDAAVDPANDPFSGLGCSGEDKEWYAYGLEFDENGKFLGYHSALCNTGSGAKYGVQVAIIADLVDICTDFDIVYDESELYSGYTNKAYTNIVWKNATNAFLSGTTLSKNTPLQPFGSLTEQVEPPKAQYAFRYETDGTPLWCGTNNLFGINYVTQLASACTALPPTTPKIVRDGDGNLGTVFKRINGFDVNSNADGKLPPQIYATNPATCQTRSSGSIARSIANSEVSGVDSTQAGCGPGPANTFTINGMTGRTGIDFDGVGPTNDEDVANDGEWDGLLGYGTYPATIQFFAFADHDRMPIRKVKVDFGDGTTPIGDKNGYFKNAKPYCAESVGECGDTQLTCNAANGTTNNTDCTNAGLTGADATCGTPAINFGNQARACTQNYFEYNYVYRCYENDAESATPRVTIANLPTALRDRALQYPNVTEDTAVCAYKPRVQVTDNWGWCNATDSSDATRRTTGNFGIGNCDRSGQQNFNWTSFGDSASRDTQDRYIYVIPKINN